MYEKVYILLLFINIAIFILLFSFVKCKKILDIKYDILTKSYNYTNYSFLNEYLDGWGISHFILYAVMVYIFPKNWLFILMIGIIWEFIEVLLSYYSILNCYLLNYGRNKYTKWWYGRYQDIIMNIFGIIFGLYLKKYF
tara:strand:- start:8345 stop:8761 length:417 start_codon:yes stop_codon:yes gene_type:complete